jgi:hypothetical protein
MKTFATVFPLAMNRFVQAAGHWNLVLLLALGMPFVLRATQTGETFATPEDAVAALVAAADAKDTNALRTIFGPGVIELANPDQVQAANERAAFAKALNQATRVQHESDSRCVLEVGEKRWPMPIPIVRTNNQWFFDTAAGKEEILNRRIGKDELATLETLRACVEAQREYSARDHGDDILKFSQKFISSPGTKDGLYWPPDVEGEISPLGPLVANAQSHGYGKDSQGLQPTEEPYHGYFFKILTGQGKNAPGGKYSYIINGNMVAGFGFVAWPAAYGQSGVMTFIVNQRGRVYQKDLGPDTSKQAEDMKEYDPDQTWNVSPD